MSQTKRSIEEIVLSSDELDNEISTVDLVKKKAADHGVLDTAKHSIQTVPILENGSLNDNKEQKRDSSLTDIELSTNITCNNAEIHTTLPKKVNCKVNGGRPFYTSKDRLIKHYGNDKPNMLKKASINHWMKNKIIQYKNEQINQIDNVQQSISEIKKYLINDSKKYEDSLKKIKSGEQFEQLSDEVNDNIIIKNESDERKKNENYKQSSSKTVTSDNKTSILSDHVGNDDRDHVHKALLALKDGENKCTKIALKKYLTKYCTKCEKKALYFKIDKCKKCRAPYFYECNMCKAPFRTMRSAMSHIKNVCARDKYWNCPWCRFVAATKDRVIYHIQLKHHNESKLHNMDNIKVQLPKQRKKEIPQQEKTFYEKDKSILMYCATCKIDFLLSESVPTICPACSNRLIWKCINCDYCSKSYCGIYDHTLNGCYQFCRYCNKKFSSKEELENHEKKCTKYHCKFCSYSTKCRDDFETHMCKAG